MGNPDRGAGRQRETGVQSVDRAITVLEILARRGQAGVSEIAVELDVHKSTAFRLLGALEERGLAEQIGDRGKYPLGFGLIPLAGRVSERLEVTQQGRSVCEDLASRLGETVNIAISDQGVAVNVDQARGPSTVTTYNWLGRLTPLHSTASGKVLLAAIDPTERAELLVDLPRTTPRTLVTPAKLAAELDDVASLGYAWALEEYEVGLNAVAAPIRDHSGSVVAALSVSGPAYRLPPDRVEEITPDAVAAGVEISRRMGHWVR